MKNRDIKFRAWDNTNKEWANVLISLYDGILDQNKQGFDEEIILMQYTGLKDKNGKEIYEGDVVNFDGIVRLPNNLVVVWGDDGFEVADEGGEGSWYVKPENMGTPWGSLCQVIGNIYENPELFNT